MKKFKLPSDKETKKKLKSLKRGSKREAMINDGAYDGRFREKSVVEKKHKKPKYKEDFRSQSL